VEQADCNTYVISRLYRYTRCVTQ